MFRGVRRGAPFQLPQRPGDHVRRGRPVRREARQQLRDQPTQGGREPRLVLLRWDRVASAVGDQDGRQAVAREGRVARGQTIKHAAQREQVAAGIDLLAIELLGRHIARRAHQHARLCQPVARVH